MKVLITANSHPLYGRVGEIIDRNGDQYALKVWDRDGQLFTLTIVEEKQFTPIKRQEDG